MRILEMLRQDVVTGLRLLRRSPGFAIAAVATLSLGIGLNTAMFSLINATLFEPLPYPDADRIVQLWLTAPGSGGLVLSIPEINLLSQQTAVFQDFAAYDFGGPGVNITGSGEPEQVKAIHVSNAYFRLFGAPVVAGRTFTSDEDRPNGGRVVILSHGLWVRRFGADRSLVGKSILLGNESYLVVGILGADFQPNPAAEIWFPLQADPNSTGQAHYVRAAARLRSGVTVDQANARLRLTVAEFRRKFPLFNPKAGFEARPLRETSVADIRTALWVLFATVTLVLLIACSNVANLLLARASTRQREIAIRAAIGASRGRLAAQLLTESLLLALAGGAVGLVGGQISLRALLALSPDVIAGFSGFSPPASLDWHVLTFAAALCLGTTLLFGFLPALGASRVSLAQTMQEGSTRTGTGHEAAKTRSLLVIVQVALAVMLVIGAGLMIRTFAVLRRVSPGIDPRQILTLQMSLQGTRFKDTASVTRLGTDGVDRLKQVPGVIAASTSWMLPVDSAFGSNFIIEGRPLGNSIVHGGALMRPVSPDYVSVFSIPLVRGRFVNARDTANAASVAVISEAMAKEFWAGGDPIGERITMDKYLGPDFAGPPREIVGIARDVRDLGMNKDPLPMIYVPQAQSPNGMTAIDVRVLPMTWAVRTGANPYSLSAAIQRALKDASGGLPVAQIRTMEQVISHSTVRSDFNTILLTAFAAVSLLLAAVGIYGLIIFSVQQKEHEIGIRIALGATPYQVRNMVMSQGMRLAMAGVLVGCLGSLALARYMKTLVYGVEPIDLPVTSFSCVTLVLVAALACYIPAYRVSRLDPANTLRSS
jgi:putative ABC transport system permease protein